MELAAPGRRVHAPSDLAIRHIRTQIDTPWTNGKFESFWATPQAEVLDRLRLDNVAETDAAARAWGVYCNYHRLHGELDWHTPAERFNGTPLSPIAASSTFRCSPRRCRSSTAGCPQH